MLKPTGPTDTLITDIIPSATLLPISNQVISPMGRSRNTIRWPERPAPWSLGLPIFDEKLGRYVSREPVKEPTKPVPSIRVSEMTVTPRKPVKEAKKPAPSIRISEMAPKPREPVKELKKPVLGTGALESVLKPMQKGYQVYKIKARKPVIRKQLKSSFMEVKKGSGAMNGPDRYPQGDGRSVSSSGISTTVEKKIDGGTRVARDKGQALFVSEISAINPDDTVQAEKFVNEEKKKTKKKRYFWEKPRQSGRRKTLSIKGETVWS